jgi:diguanylate cyclase (GGDEF)-like protein
VILPNTDFVLGKLIAERIREAVSAAALDPSPQPGGRVTVSIGVATGRSGDEGSQKDMVHTADVALYEAKRAGRNCVRSHY